MDDFLGRSARIVWDDSLGPSARRRIDHRFHQLWKFARHLLAGCVESTRHRARRHRWNGGRTNWNGRDSFLYAARLDVVRPRRNDNYIRRRLAREPEREKHSRSEWIAQQIHYEPRR